MSVEVLPTTIVVLSAQIRALLPEWLQYSLHDFEFLSGGYSNENYAFSVDFGASRKSYVLRLPKVQQPFVNRELEARWYDVLPDHIGVKPVALDTVSGAMITAKLDGQILAEVFADNFAEQDLLNYVKTLHGSLPKIERHYDISELAKLYGARAPEFDALHLGQSCHNDLNPWNIIVTEDGWRTIDWEFVGLNDPLFDLVALHQGLELPAIELGQLCYEFIGYVDEDRLTNVHWAFWYREWAWADFQIRSGNLREEIVQQRIVAMKRLANF